MKPDFFFNGELDIQLGVTDFCNLRCIMCQQTAWRGVYGAPNEKAPVLHEGNCGFMERGVLKHFIDSLIRHKYRLRVLSLMWIGESLLHPEFPELLTDILAGLSEFDFADHLVLNTNATLFTEEIEQILLAYKSHPDSVPFTLVFSLDAATADKFRRLKGVDLYSDAEANVKRFLRNRSKISINPYRPLTTAIQTLVMPENRDEMKLFHDQWSEFLTTENIEFDRCWDTLHGFTDTKLYFKRTSSVKQEEVEALHREVVEELALAHPFILQKERIVEFDSSLETETKEQRRPCPAPFRTATINWDGTVVPCCIDTEMQLTFGRIGEEDFPLLYEGAVADELRKSHLMGNLEKYPVCLHCRNLHYPPVPDQELTRWLTERNLTEEVKPFIKRMKSAGKLRPSKPWQLIEPLDFRGLKQTLILELSATCNLRCIMCEQSFDPTRKDKGLMKMELYQKVIDELVETKARANVVNLFWSGESLVHPKFLQMIKYAADKNHDYSGFGAFDLHTNGNPLNETISREIVKGRQFARILFSLDASTPETYDQIRRGGDLLKVIGNIKELVKLRNETGADWPCITLQYVVSSLNEPEALDFLQIADSIFGEKNYQVNWDWDQPAPFSGDVVFFKRIDELTTDDQITSEDVHRKLCIKLGFIKETQEGRIVESDEYRVDDHGMNPLTGEVAVRRPCVGLFTHMAIRWNGDVTACCRDIKCDLKIGNAKDASLMELFNSDRLTRMRLKHIEGHADDIAACRDCPNQICPVITDEEVIHYLKSVGRPDLILPWKKRMQGGND